MRMSRVGCVVALLATCVVQAPVARAQPAASLSDSTRAYVSVAEPVVVLANATIIDGTGTPPRANQSIVVRDGKIAEVGPASSVHTPAGARVIDLNGQTVIPGIVGMHDHLFYTAAGGRRTLLWFTGPRLYLGSGVTTIRTAGAMAPYADINTKQAIDAGHAPGPRIVITSPYVTGPEPGDPRTVRERLTSPEQARTFVDYWAGEGAAWVKVYTDIHATELKAVIDEAHKRGIKVMGHLCSISYGQAVDLGIDNLEHGFLTATDFDPTKQPDVCPVGSTTESGHRIRTLMSGRRSSRRMVDHKVPMTSTLSVFEASFPNRPVTDQRSLDAMAPETRTAYLALRAHIDSGPAVKWALTVDMLKNAMAFEREFVAGGGLLAVGVRPHRHRRRAPRVRRPAELRVADRGGLHSAAGHPVHDRQRGPHPRCVRSVRVDRKGQGRGSRLVLNGNLPSDPSVIRKVTIVFKDGVGYDSPKLIASVAGRVGID